ncbi:MAG: DUF3794 domain-containing protein, partial [Clostridia bacterium]|nr:DUF3794 domain-containing protein [Clostridia bacterium]
SGDVSLLQRLPDVQKLLHATSDVRLLECQVVTGRVFIHGEADLRLLYVCPQGELYAAPMTMPFDAAVDLEGGEDATAEGLTVDAACEQVDIFIEHDGDGNRRVARVAIACKFNAQCRQAVAISALSDAFVPEADMNLTHAELCLAAPEVVVESGETLSYTLSPSEGMPAVSRVLATLTAPCAVAAETREGEATVSGAIAFTVLYQSVGEAGVQGFTQNVPFANTVAHPAFAPDMPANAKVTVDECTAVPQAAFEVECRIPLRYSVKLLPHTTVRALAGAEMGETAGENEGVCALVFMEKDETLWDVAKRYGVSPDCLREQNPGLAEPVGDGARVVVYRAMM